MSVGVAGQPSNGLSGAPELGHGGLRLPRARLNLVAGDTNDNGDVFVRGPLLASTKAAAGVGDVAENDFAKRGIALSNRGDMDALRERYHPEAVMHRVTAGPGLGPSVGRDAIFDQFRRLRGRRTDLLEMTVSRTPGDWIVWEYRWTAMGLESGLPMELVGAKATRYSAGQIVEVRFCTRQGRGPRSRGAAGVGDAEVLLPWERSLAQHLRTSPSTRRHVWARRTEGSPRPAPLARG